MNKPYIYSEKPYNENLNPRITFALARSMLFDIPTEQQKTPDKITGSKNYADIPSLQIFARPRVIQKVGR